MVKSKIIADVKRVSLIILFGIAVSCVLNLASDIINMLFGREGFNGQLSNLYFYNYPVGQEKSNELYYKGPTFYSWFYWLVGKLQGKKLIADGSQ